MFDKWFFKSIDFEFMNCEKVSGFCINQVWEASLSSSIKENPPWEMGTQILGFISISWRTCHLKFPNSLIQPATIHLFSPWTEGINVIHIPCQIIVSFQSKLIWTWRWKLFLLTRRKKRKNKETDRGKIIILIKEIKEINWNQMEWNQRSRERKLINEFVIMYG